MGITETKGGEETETIISVFRAWTVTSLSAVLMTPHVVSAGVERDSRPNTKGQSAVLYLSKSSNTTV